PAGLRWSAVCARIGRHACPDRLRLGHAVAWGTVLLAGGWMRRLRVVGLAEDGGHLVVSTDADDCFLLPSEEEPRAAARGQAGQQQLPLAPPTPLRPREIQVRVRAGASPEQVAAESGMSVERVMRFAYPVLAERSQVVLQARRTRIRRDPGA